MVKIAIQRFDEPDAYHAAIRNLVTGVVTERGSYRAKLMRADFDRVWMLSGDEHLASVLNFTPSGQRATILFPADPHQRPVHVSGREMAKTEITVVGYDSSSYFRSSAESRWRSMSLSHDEFAAASTALIGRELVAPRLSYHVTPRPDLLARLTSVHAAAARVAELTPDILSAVEVARAIEQELIYAMVMAVGAEPHSEMVRTSPTHAAALRRLESVLESHIDRPLYVAELCAAAGVSDRTLRAVCEAHLGMSPMRYLQLRRMHLARRALRVADPGANTVTAIATHYGFWELGRFSVAYRSLFGESPLTTLRRQAREPKAEKFIGSPWHLPEFA